VKKKQAQERLIVAIDQPDLKRASKLIRSLRGTVSFYKIGLELFTAQGWRAVELVQKYGGRVFLDLKLHDIPNTVYRTMKVVCSRQIDMVNIHTLGGLQMIEAAAAAKREMRSKTKLLGVTVLTSHDENSLRHNLRIPFSVKSQVGHLAKLAHKGGCDGVVCSAVEAKGIKKISRSLLTVTPGIRPISSPVGDQKRIMSPAKAIMAGSDFLVVGRPISEAKSPQKAALAVLQEMDQALLVSL